MWKLAGIEQKKEVGQLNSSDCSINSSFWGTERSSSFALQYFLQNLRGTKRLPYSLIYLLNSRASETSGHALKLVFLRYWTERNTNFHFRFPFPFAIGKRNLRLSFFNFQFPVKVSENGNRTSLSLSVVPMSLQNGIRTSIFIFRFMEISLAFLAMLELSSPWEGQDCKTTACLLRQDAKRRKRDLSRASLTRPRGASPYSHSLQPSCSSGQFERPISERLTNLEKAW